MTSLSSAKLGERWPVRCIGRPNWIRFAAYRHPEPVPTSGKLPCTHGFRPSHRGRIAVGILARRGMKGSSCAMLLNWVLSLVVNLSKSMEKEIEEVRC